jgi:hypothetical protein
VADATPDQIDPTELTGFVRRMLRIVNAVQVRRGWWAKIAENCAEINGRESNPTESKSICRADRLASFVQVYSSDALPQTDEACGGSGPSFSRRRRFAPNNLIKTNGTNSPTAVTSP